MIVVFSRRAAADLEEIGDWIARDNPERAVTFVQELRLACAGVAENPRLYPFLRGTRTLRRKLFSPYLILYRVRKRDVIIVSIRHGARDNRGLR